MKLKHCSVNALPYSPSGSRIMASASKKAGVGRASVLDLSSVGNDDRITIEGRDAELPS